MDLEESEVQPKYLGKRFEKYSRKGGERDRAYLEREKKARDLSTLNATYQWLPDTIYLKTK